MEKTISRRQATIRNICVAVESAFCGKLNQRAFCARFAPILVVLLLVYFDCCKLFCSIPFVRGLILAALLVVSLPIITKRFHSIHKSGANMLRIIIPTFVYFWIVPKLPDYARTATTIILFILPVVTLLQLFCIPCKDSEGDSEQ